MKDCDPSTGLPDSDEGYDDEYMLEDIEITVADQIQKSKKQNFNAAWDSADTEGDIFKFYLLRIVQVKNVFKFQQNGSKRRTPSSCRRSTVCRRR